MSNELTFVLCPDAYSVVVTGRNEQVLRRVPRHELDVLCVSVQHRDALKVGLRIGFPDPDAFITTASSQVRS